MMAFARSKISWLRWIVMGSERSLEIPGAAATVWHNHATPTKLQLVGIRGAAIISKGALSAPSNPIVQLDLLAQMANSFEGIEDAMKEAVRRATSQYTVRFDGTRLDWDGTAQDLTMLVGADELEPVTVQMGTAHKLAAETPWFLRWWAQLTAGVLLVGLIMIGQRLRGRSVI